MISFDKTGTHRLVYKSETFVESLTVTAYLWSPSLVKSDLQTFTEVEDGLYYLDYNFADAGTYAGLFYEDGTKKTGIAIRIQPAGAAAEAGAIVAALLAETGITEGGTWTFAKVMKVINAFAVMKMQLKTGTTATYEILDPDDETTVVAELTTGETSPPTISILI